jgi:hypothetical protein
MVGHPSQAPANIYTGMHQNGVGWLWYVAGSDMAAARYVDLNNGGYYVDPASSSNLNTAQFANAYRTYGFNGPEYDVNNGGYYVDPNSTSNLYAGYRYYGFNGPEYDGNNGGYYVDPNGTSNFVDLRMSYMYDNNDTSYYLDLNNTTRMRSYTDANGNWWAHPNGWNYMRGPTQNNSPIYWEANTAYQLTQGGQSRLNNIWLDYMSCMSSWCPQNYVMRLTPNIHLNSVQGYAVYLNWDNGAAGGLQFSVGNGAGSHMFHVRGDGFAQCAWQCTNGSDERLKKDIRAIDSPLDKILKLNGVYYEYDKVRYPEKTKTLPDTRQMGFVAQQIESTVPEVVVTDDDGFKSVGYGNVTALLTEGIKEQQKQIKANQDKSDAVEKATQAQKTEIEQLKLEIAELKSRMSALEK